VKEKESQNNKKQRQPEKRSAPKRAQKGYGRGTNERRRVIGVEKTQGGKDFAIPKSEKGRVVGWPTDSMKNVAGKRSRVAKADRKRWKPAAGEKNSTDPMTDTNQSKGEH